MDQKSLRESSLKLLLSLIRLADMLCKENRDEEALVGLEKILSFTSADANLPYAEGLISQRIGIIMQKFCKHEEAISYHSKDLEISRRYRDRLGEAYAVGNLGLCYLVLREYEVALDLHRQQIKIAKELNDFELLSSAYGNAGVTLRHLNSINESIKYFNNSLQISITNNDQIKILRTHANLGKCFYLKKNYKDALKRYEICVCIAEKINDYENAYLSQRNIASIYIHQGQFENSMKAFQRCIEFKTNGGRKDLCTLAILSEYTARNAYFLSKFHESIYYAEESIRIFDEYRESVYMKEDVFLHIEEERAYGWIILSQISLKQYMNALLSIEISRRKLCLEHINKEFITKKLLHQVLIEMKSPILMLHLFRIVHFPSIVVGFIIVPKIPDVEVHGDVEVKDEGDDGVEEIKSPRYQDNQNEDGLYKDNDFPDIRIYGCIIDLHVHNISDCAEWLSQQRARIGMRGWIHTELTNTVKTKDTLVYGLLYRCIEILALRISQLGLSIGMPQHLRIIFGIFEFFDCLDIHLFGYQSPIRPWKRDIQIKILNWLKPYRRYKISNRSNKISTVTDSCGSSRNKDNIENEHIDNDDDSYECSFFVDTLVRWVEDRWMRTHDKDNNDDNIGRSRSRPGSGLVAGAGAGATPSRPTRQTQNPSATTTTVKGGRGDSGISNGNGNGNGHCGRRKDCVMACRELYDVLLLPLEIDRDGIRMIYRHSYRHNPSILKSWQLMKRHQTPTAPSTSTSTSTSTVPSTGAAAAEGSSVSVPVPMTIPSDFLRVAMGEEEH
eukprot:gene7765-15888_t